MLSRLRMQMELSYPITMEELRKPVKAANDGKAPGQDSIPDEVIKHGGVGLLQQLLSSLKEEVHQDLRCSDSQTAGL